MTREIHKKKRSWKFGCLLTSLFFLYFIISVLNYGEYTLKPGESVKLKVNPRTDQLEYYSILIFKNPSGGKLELSGEDIWAEHLGDVFYKIKEQRITELKEKGDKYEEVGLTEAPVNGIYLSKNGIIVESKKKHIFDVTTATNKTITIKNLSNKTISFSAEVENH
ncbi:hypothetical protein [Streptococcus oricebi]|uniref:DUF1850 domain-containing protein n=1 Tax=Streptococcus oricebi TaxID=1547447 RepID=A0ABS5B4D0_9STRE|nr:hypothetical protein [Streptococcus oricebi]MBP2623692.1 hypothetical protein [Streptococcus oricebi]